MTAIGADVSIGARLAAVAQRVPDRLAIVEGDARLDYRALHARATAIAHGILAAGQDRPGPVCLLFESKLVAITAIFGAGRAGRAYVPLDAGDPDERLRFILDDSAPIALVTESKLLQRARALAPAGCTIVDVDMPAASAAAGALPEIAADTPLYRFYTSGSTGRPKGVGQTHRNLLFFVDAYVKTLGVVEADRVSLLYTLSFSGANMDIYGALLNGATLCTYDPRCEGVAQLAGWLDRERITVLHCVPTVFRELMNGLAPDRKLVHLRAIDLGGEAVFDSDVALFRQHTQEDCVLVNHLAITEASVVAQHVVDHRSARFTGGILSVGRSPAGVRVTIRNDDGSAAAAGEVGEIVVASAHISPGYWNRPELNAAAFAEDPATPGVRRYFTGDLGRVDVDGNLHFLGRRGTRIKLRGHSVDLTEVEAAICAYPGVTKAAVLAVEGSHQGDSDKLVAYLAVDAEANRDAGSVRRRMAALVPSYMLPSSFLFMDELPLTASGKIDRKALAHVYPERAAPSRASEPPRDDVERGVARVFEQLLKLAAVGRDDDFFLMGGDSLRAVELQIRLREAFGVHVTNLHEDATVARIAATIRSSAASPHNGIEPIPVLVPLWQNGTAPPLFLVHGRHGQAFVSPQFMQLLGDNQPIWAFQARGLDGLREPHATVEDMAAEYLAEMRRQRPHGPYFLGSLCAGAYVAAVMARALRDDGETVLPLLILDPPSGQPQRDYAHMGEEKFVRKMNARRARGITPGPVDDPASMKALRDTAMAFEDALTRHQPRPYDGAVYVLTSVARMQAGSTHLRQIFTGRFKRYEVGTTHAEALDPRNPVFANTLQRCVGLIREAAQAR